jgi:hypothetical protein
MKYNVGDMFLITGNSTFLYIIDKRINETEDNKLDPNFYLTVHIHGDNHYYEEFNEQFLQYQVEETRYYIYYPNEI